MPTSAELNRTGSKFQVEGDKEGARLHYLAALSVDPNNWMALGNLGALTSEQENLDAAVVYAQKSVRLVPGDGRQYNNLGNILMRLNCFRESAEVLERAKEIAPDDPVTWQNLALLNYREGKFEAALEYMDAVLRMMPNSVQIKTDRGHVLLAMGRLQEGLAAYENRWYNLVHLPPWDLMLPEWKGEDLLYKHILFHSEQGFGDSFMTSRFARDLVSRGARVTMALPPSLVRLFRLQEWPGVEVISLDEVDNPSFRFDYHSPMYSALRWLGYSKEDIHPEPFLKNCLKPFDLGTGPDLKVGICWASGKWNAETAMRRTIDLRLFLPLAGVPGVKLWSLQKGEGEGDIERLGAEGLITDSTRLLRDWADTAALVENLDLIIAVDTAVAHLAGAMGKEVWMLSPYTRCWRWWDIASALEPGGRGDTGWPWYSSMKIFAQWGPHSWRQTMEQVVRSLEAKTTPDEFKVAAD
jgi:hypothetical protein